MSIVADLAWLETINDVLKYGVDVQGQQSTGAVGRVSREILQHTMVIDLRYPFITTRPGLDWKYMAAEPLWVLAGSDDLYYNDVIQKIQTPYANGNIVKGAYGPKWKTQIEYIVNTLKRDSNSRQAVMTIWERNPDYRDRDIPCLCTLQWLIRDGYIQCNAWMRSSDVWVGLTYDIFVMSCLTYELNQMLDMSLDLGSLAITAGSRHIYDEHIQLAKQSVDNFFWPDKLVPASHMEQWKWPALKQKMRDVQFKDNKTAKIGLLEIYNASNK